MLFIVVWKIYVFRLAFLYQFFLRLSYFYVDPNEYQYYKEKKTNLHIVI